MTHQYLHADSKHLAAALRHAEMIQRQKTVDRQNFDALERLLDCPWTVDANVQRPTNADMLEVNKLLQLFRPVDFDELVNERRLADMCGYVLCAERLCSRKGKIYRPRMHIDEVDPWCSRECLRRAVFLKAQLNHEPGWLRITSTTIPFRFPIGQVNISQPSTSIQSTRPCAAGDDSAEPSQLDARATTQLDVGLKANITEDLLADKVVECSTAGVHAELSQLVADSAHNAIEGYVI